MSLPQAMERSHDIQAVAGLPPTPASPPETETLTPTSEDFSGQVPAGPPGLAPVPSYAHLNSAQRKGTGRATTNYKKIERSRDWVQSAEASLREYVQINPHDDRIEKEILQVRYYRQLVDSGEELTGGQMEKCREIIRLVDRRMVGREMAAFADQSTENSRQRAERGIVFDGRRCLLGEGSMGTDMGVSSVAQDVEDQAQSHYDTAMVAVPPSRRMRPTVSSKRGQKPSATLPRTSSSARVSKPRARESNIHPNPAIGTRDLFISASPSPSPPVTTDSNNDNDDTTSESSQLRTGGKGVIGLKTYHPSTGGKGIPTPEPVPSHPEYEGKTLPRSSSHPSWGVKTVPYGQPASPSTSPVPSNIANYETYLEMTAAFDESENAETEYETDMDSERKMMMGFGDEESGFEHAMTNRVLETIPEDSEEE